MDAHMLEDPAQSRRLNPLLSEAFGSEREAGQGLLDLRGGEPVAEALAGEGAVGEAGAPGGEALEWNSLLEE
jgi:hypothetical protein